MKPLAIAPLLALLVACSGDEPVSADLASAPAEDYHAESVEMLERSDPGLAVSRRTLALPPEVQTHEFQLPGEQAVSLDPMLIRTGRATVRVDSLDRGVAAVRALARRNGGLVGAMTVSAGEERARHATLEVRIPSERFDSAVVGLAPIGRVEGIDVTAQDVGEEYADVEARVANARRLESRLLELLERRTGRLEEMLQLEREVARVREQVERHEGRLRYLRTRASVSVLTVTLREPEALIGSPPGEQPLRDAVGQAWRSFIGLVAGLIAASGLLIPFALLAFALWRGWRALRRRDAEADAAYRARLRREREAVEEERTETVV
jgi:hypothetical protein